MLSRGKPTRLSRLTKADAPGVWRPIQRTPGACMTCTATLGECTCSKRLDTYAPNGEPLTPDRVPQSNPRCCLGAKRLSRVDDRWFQLLQIVATIRCPATAIHGELRSASCPDRVVGAPAVKTGLRCELCTYSIDKPRHKPWDENPCARCLQSRISDDSDNQHKVARLNASSSQMAGMDSELWLNAHALAGSNWHKSEHLVERLAFQTERRYQPLGDPIVPL